MEGAVQTTEKSVIHQREIDLSGRIRRGEIWSLILRNDTVSQGYLLAGGLLSSNRFLQDKRSSEGLAYRGALESPPL